MDSSSEFWVLVLEDEPLIALDLEDILQNAGFQDVVTISSRADAQQWLSEHTPHIAVVDPNLRDGVCFEVIQTLTERNSSSIPENDPRMRMKCTVSIEVIG